MPLTRRQDLAATHKAEMYIDELKTPVQRADALTEGLRRLVHDPPAHTSALLISGAVAADATPDILELIARLSELGITARFQE